MTTFTYQSLYESRCRYGKPFYWKPQVLKKEAFDFDTDGVPECLERILAMALHLEIPVGSWVANANKQDLPISDVAHKLLRSNIGDENVHFYQFKHAVNAYGVSDQVMAEAEEIGKMWEQNESHPLEKAQLAETGVFLTSLSLMRIAGGNSLCTVAMLVSQDETRHVATNRGILKDIGIDPSAPNQPLENLRNTTLDWLLEGLNLSGEYLGFDFNLDREFFKEQATSLVTTGRSEVLEELTDGSSYTPPFESANRYLY